MNEGRVARGSDGADLMRRLYRGSPLRWVMKVELAHRGTSAVDVFLASYPRSGSSWLRFLCLELVSGDASFERISQAVPYVGAHRHAPSFRADGARLIKTHEPYLARYRRAVHLVRDPRDVALSYFRFMQRIQKIVLRPGDDEAASLDHFIDAFLGGRVDAHGTWQTHLRSWLAAARDGNCDVLPIRYEDLRADPVAGVLRIATWLGLELTQDEAERVAQRCSLDRMRAAEEDAVARTPDVFVPRARHSGVSLINKGLVGGWQDVLTADQKLRFDVFADGLEQMNYVPATT